MNQVQAIAKAAQEVPNAPEPAPKTKTPRISKKMKTAVSLLLSGECKSQKAACARVNLTESYFSQALQKPHIRAYVARKTRNFVDQAQMPAASVLIGLLEAESETVKKDVATQLLRIAGIAPPERAGASVNVNISPGYVIDLSGASPPAPGDSATVINQEPSDAPSPVADEKEQG